MPDPRDDFYVGYRPRTSPTIARRVRGILIGLGTLFVALPLTLVLFQSGFSDAIFDWTTPRTLEGTLRTRPYPRLEVPDERSDGTSYLLVAPGKFGLEVPTVTFDGRVARVTGELIQRGELRMLQVRADDVDLQPGAGEPPMDERSLGSRRLVGEIVDSKCYLGVMKPGRGKPHRSCAARCISGGVPPMLLVTSRAGDTRQLLLLGPDGGPLGVELLDLVAEPVEIEGEVVLSGDLWYLRTDRAAIRRVAP